MEQELLLLGLLRESPKHGYEIKKKIKEILSVFAGIDFKSIYYPLRILEKKGLILKSADKKGKRPQRFIYELTTRGQQRFREMLFRSFLDLKRPRFSLDLSLYFLNYIEPRLLKRRLRGRMLMLDKLSRSMRQIINSSQGKENPPLLTILEHNLGMVEAERRFLYRLTSRA